MAVAQHKVSKTRKRLRRSHNALDVVGIFRKLNRSINNEKSFIIIWAIPWYVFSIASSENGIR